MAGMTQYLAESLINHVLRASAGGTSYSQPALVYLALHTDDPGPSGGLNEVIGGSYARQLITFGAPINNETSNSSIITFHMPACSVSYFSIWDASTSGNCLFTDSLASTLEFNTADTFEIQASALKISQIGS